MIYSVTLLFGLILAPLLVQLRGYKPAALFFTVAAVYAVFGAASFARIQIALSQVREAEPAYQETYYVMSHAYFLLNIGIAMAVFGAITLAQTRFGVMRYPGLTKLLFWILHITLIGSTSFQGVLAFILPKPRRYIDYPEFMETYLLIISWSGVLSQAALLGLLCLLLWSITARWLAS
ncbi:MAG: hypothetical protein KBT70_16425 [Roseovarius sp.]|uniref:hypothetical protein n=1 Tax=Roseovarius sp. TaxID=1486281 RepID=UPI001B4B4385|nr:hypothetical protein [Roseovarius sp.]MBQ0751781.1 hypothetical protein [Roseovarius sp.]